MKSALNRQEGFTAVELLITLIIASMFLFAGYQLYTQVTRDGNDANVLAKASNIGYEKMRVRASEVSTAQPNGCTTSGGSNVVTEQGITYVTEVTCPQGFAASVDLFKVTVRAYKPNPSGGSGYGPLIMEHSTYVN